MFIVKSVQINRSPEEVFGFISDLSNHRHIFKANIKSWQATEGPVGVGTEMVNLAKFMGKKMEEHFVITAYEPNDHIRKESMPGSTVPTWDIMNVKRVDKGTLFTYTVYANPVGYFRIFGPLLTPMVSKVIAKDLKNFKRFLEQ